MLDLLYCLAVTGGQICAVQPSSLNPATADAGPTGFLTRQFDQ